jgi:putative ABC transport system permease protein
MRPSPVADRVLNVRLERGSDKRLSTKRVDEAVDNVVAGLLRAPGVRDVIRMQDAHLLETRLTAGDPERQVTPPPERAMAIRVPAGYLRVMGIPIVAGRDINTDDIALRRRVVVVGSGFARTVWGTSNPLGKQLWTTSHTSGRSYEVIGVFDGSDGRDDGRRGSFAEHRYELDAFQEEWRAYANGDSNTGDALLVRTTGPGASAGPMIRAVVRQAAPELVVSRMNTLLELHESEFSNMMRGMTLAGIGGAAMLLLACAGLYAVIAFGVASREREIGVRIALGARPREVVSLFLRRGLRLTVVGIVVGVVPGIVIAPAVTRGYVERALGAGPVPGFAVVIGFVALLLIVVSAVAILIPARRAATVDPLVALRAE